MSDSNSELIKAIVHYQQCLEKYARRNNEQRMLYCIGKLYKMPITVEHLEQTGVGRTVNSLRKVNGEVGDAAKSLVAKWKEMVVGEDNETKDSSAKPESSKSHKEESKSKKQKEGSSSSSHKESDRKSKHEHKDKSSSNYSNGEDSYSTKVKEDSKYKNYEESHKKHKESSHHRHKSSKQKKDSETSDSDDNEYEKSKIDHKHKSSHKSSKRKQESSNSDSDDEYDKSQINSYKHKSSKHKKEESLSEDEYQYKVEKDKGDRHVQKSSKRKRDDSDYDDEEYDQVSSKHKKYSEDEESESDDEEKEMRSQSHKQQNKHKDESYSFEKDKSKHSYKHKDKKERKEYSTEDKPKKYAEENKIKDKSSSKDKGKSHSENKEKEESKKSKPSSSSKHHKEHKSSKKSSSQSSKSKVVVHENGIGSGSGTSFAEALGMLEPSSSKTNKKKIAVIHPFPVERSNDSNISTPEISKPEKIDVLKEKKLEPLDINITNLLPEITPNYRPLGNFPLDSVQSKSKVTTEEEALSAIMYNKISRTKVYSGNKVIWGKVPTLFDLCTHVLQDNIDALEYTGGVPYIILKPVIERANPDQLFQLEHHNPYLIEDTDELWQLHCQREFRNKKREEMETWRDMYMRCMDEREAKLKALTANIKQSQDKSLPVRQTKLAYVDGHSIVKPPRSVARKQAKHGTAGVEKKPLVTPSSRLSALATAGAAGQIAVPNPGAKAASSSGSSSAVVKPKKAPLMQKTLAFMKNRLFRR